MVLRIPGRRIMYSDKSIARKNLVLMGTALVHWLLTALILLPLLLFLVLFTVRSCCLRAWLRRVPEYP